MVEGTVIVIQDSKLGKKYSKFVIAAVLCVFGAAISTIFCFNWGYALFDSIDHYLNIYTIMLMAIFQAIGAGWIHCADDAFAASKVSNTVLMVGFFGVLVPLPWLKFFAFFEMAWVGIIAFWVWFMVICVISCLCAKMGGNKLTVQQWYDEIFLAGVRPICLHMQALSESEWGTFTGRLFEFWWCFSIKYISPWALYTLLVLTVEGDIEKPYGSYHKGW